MAFPTVTRLAAGRTVLREVVAGDLPALFEVNGDDAVTRFLPYATWQSHDDGVAWFMRMQALTAGGSAQQLVIARADDERAIGTALLMSKCVGFTREGRLRQRWVAEGVAYDVDVYGCLADEWPA